MQKLKVKPEECIMVGDWPERDIKGASQIGMKTAFARYGSMKKTAKADYVLNDIKDLIRIV